MAKKAPAITVEEALAYAVWRLNGRCSTEFEFPLADIQAFRRAWRATFKGRDLKRGLYATMTVRPRDAS